MPEYTCNRVVTACLVDRVGRLTDAARRRGEALDRAPTRYDRRAMFELHGPSRLLALTAAAVVGLVLGCQSPHVVGGACRDDRDCAEFCVEGKSFPAGTCTVDCVDDYDCPGFAACVQKEGGICLPMCELDRECRDGYSCKDEDREGAGGKIAVCIN
jgi:hypothetical protein